MQTAIVTCASHPEVKWLEGATCPYDDKLAVFRFRLPNGGKFGTYLRTLLQPDERARADRYYRDEDRHRFVYTRGILRLLAGKYTRQLPSSIRFTTGLNNKPELSGNTGWHINVSHSGSWILIAIGSVSLGVDVEQINPDFPFQEVMPPTFSQEEQRSIEASTDARLLFYQLWTRKEALVKATAKGLNDDLPKIPSLDGVHEISGTMSSGMRNWLVAGFMVADTYPAAVAYREMAEIPKFYALESVLFGDYES